MNTKWTDRGNVVYLVPVPTPDKHRFLGAYGPHSKAVYRQNGSKIQYLPDDLILDDALAVAKIIIMTDRNKP